MTCFGHRQNIDLKITCLACQFPFPSFQQSGHSRESGIQSVSWLDSAFAGMTAA